MFTDVLNSWDLIKWRTFFGSFDIFFEKQLLEGLQARTKYLKKTLVFMLNSVLREKFNLYFQEVFC